MKIKLSIQNFTVLSHQYIDKNIGVHITSENPHSYIVSHLSEKNLFVATY